MDRTDALIRAMMRHDRGHPQLIQHFLKVHAFAKMIGWREGLDEDTQKTLEAAAIVHDIGILASLRVYGDDAGRHQEELGPAEAEEMLRGLGYEEETIRRVSALVGRHHTYTGVDGVDCRILIEADFLVNLYENGCGKEAVSRARESVFRTQAGLDLLDTMFCAE